LGVSPPAYDLYFFEVRIVLSERKYKPITVILLCVETTKECSSKEKIGEEVGQAFGP
jgi:hypothetical protein